MQITMRLYTLIFLATMLFPTLLMSQVSEDAQKLFDAGKYSQAKQLLEKELEENPSNVSINYLLGRTALYTGDIETAKQTLTLAKNKRMNDATLYLGRLYAMQYDFANAEKEFKLYERAMRRNK